MHTILITGATGQLGGAVIDLLTPNSAELKLKALARNPEDEKAKALTAKGVEVVYGDYDKPDSLKEAFKGVDKLYFVSASDIEKRVPQHHNVVNAAREAGVKHIVYTSFARKNETESSPIYMVAEAHLKTEEWIKASAMTYTILKHNLYMDFVPFFIGENVFETGLYLPAGDGRAALLSRSDMARVGAAVLTGAGHENKEYNVSSDESVSYEDIAGYLSEISGKEVSYTSPDPQEYHNTLKKAGVPEEMIGVSLGFALAAAQGELSETSHIFEELTGKKPLRVKDFLKSVYGK